MITETFDLKGLNNQLQELLAENKRLQHLKERYIEHSKTVKELTVKFDHLKEELINLAKELDPVSFQRKRSGKQINTEPYINDLYDIMKNGTEVTRDLIEHAFPDLTSNNITWIFYKLQKLPQVEYRKEGNKKFLYMRNT